MQASAQKKLMDELGRAGVRSTFAEGFVRVLDANGRQVMSIEVSAKRSRSLPPHTLHFNSKLVEEFTSHVVDDIKFAMELLGASK